MHNKRVLLTKEQLGHLSTECVYEFIKLPRYDINAQIALISQYINKVQLLITDNIKSLVNDAPDGELSLILGRILMDRIEN